MNEARRVTGATHLVSFGVAFIISLYSVSNLMSLLLHVAAKGLTAVDGMAIAVYVLVGSLSICFLARAIYRSDKKAGRVRNQIGWFE